MKNDVIYLASPKKLYDKPIYNVILKRIRKRYPHAEIIAAKGLYRDADEFNYKWPKILQRITTLIFASDNGTIALGTYTEIHDAREKGLNIFYISDDMSFIHIDNVKAFLINGGSDWTKYVQVRIA